jgi:uncharacterized protein (TIGR03663 family)
VTDRRFILAFLAVFIVALVLRVVHLDLRPMHNDEGVNAIKATTLWKIGRYAYDPNEFHGPTLPYLSLPFIWAGGSKNFADVSESTLRMLPAVFGIILILLLLLLRDALGTATTVFAAAFTAISPAFVFYSRYYIHEMLLVCFTLMAVAAGWRYIQSRRAGWAVMGGVAVGLMYATKETFVFALGALASAFAFTFFWNRWRVRRTTLGDTDRIFFQSAEKQFTGFNAWHAVLAVASALIISMLLFTSFFKNPDGPADSLSTYLEWMRRAAGDSVHAQGMGFYFERLFWFQRNDGPLWSEGMILVLAIAGIWASFFGGPFVIKNAGFGRFIAVYTITLAAIYTAISYKTPWCALGFWHGAILLAGIGAGALLQTAHKSKWLLVTLLALGSGHLMIQSWRAVTSYGADPKNPYVYAHTSPGIRDLIGQVDALAVVHKEGREMAIKVISPGDDYWPLPWYLRGFNHTGWWKEVPEDPFAPVMIVSTKWRAALDARGTHVMTGLHPLRPDAFFELYVETNLWATYLQSRKSSSESIPAEEK